MIIGVLQLELSIPQARSLKDKRSAIKGLKDRLIGRYHVSAAEVDLQDVMRSSVIAVVMVGNARRVVESHLSKIVDVVAGQGTVILNDYALEFL